MDWLTNVDHAILLAIQEFCRNSVLTPVFRFITHLGDYGLFWIGFTALLLCLKRTRKTGLLCAGALIGSLLINNALLKNLVARPRPFDAFSDILPLIKRPLDFSFPSGHTGSSFAFAWVFFRRMPKKYGIPVLVLAALVAFSRLYLGVHYPGDVLGGLITGILIGEAQVRLLAKLESSKAEKSGL